MHPKVSVLMAVYKTDRGYLREAVESILNQSFDDFEFLIADDCPEDDREEIVRSYNDKRIIYFKNEKNLGITPTRNKLLDLAKGEYVAVFDHDDISLQNRLAKQVKFLDDNPKVGVVGCWYEKFPKHKLKKTYVVDCQIKKNLMTACAVLHPSSMIRKEVLDKNNIRYEQDFSPAEDYALWCRLLGKTKFANLPEVLFKYRDYAGNTSKKQSLKMEQGRQKVYEMLQKEYPKEWKAAHFEQSFKFCGIPLLSKKTYGCYATYTLLNFLKIKTNEPIDLQVYSEY